MLDCAYYETPRVAYRHLGLLCTGYGRAERKTLPCQSRRLDCYAAVWISHGSGWLETSATAERLAIAGGSLFWLFPGVTHTYMPDARGWSEQWVLFEGEQAASFTELGFLSAAQPLHTLSQSEAIEAIFTQLHTDFRQGGHLSSVLGGALVSRLILLVHQQTLQGQIEQHPLYRELQQYKRAIEEQAFTTCSLEEIARGGQKSYATLRRHFKEAFGFTPKEYVLHLRLRKAQASLAFTQQSIAEVAYSVGFTDPYYFSRLFHARTGLTPSLFRQQQRMLPIEQEETKEIS